jgi:hypothetical protein
MTGDASLVINKMALDRENRQHPRTNGNGTKSPSTVPSKRRRRSLTPSDDSEDDDAAQDFDSDDLDDVDVRRKRKKKQPSTIGAASRRREAAGRPPAGGSVLAAAGLDIYAMFGRKPKEQYVPLSRLFPSFTDLDGSLATSHATVIRIRKTIWKRTQRRFERRRLGRQGRRGRMIGGRRPRSGGAPRRSAGGRRGDGDAGDASC